MQSNRPPFTPPDSLALTAPASMPHTAPASQIVPNYPDPIIELPMEDLIEAGQTKPLQIASILHPGVAQPFTPPPAPVVEQPVMLPPATPAPHFNSTLPSMGSVPPPPGAAWAQPQPQAYPSWTPTAMDVAPVHQAPTPKKKSYGWIFAILGVVAVLGIGAVGGGGYFVYRMREAADEAAQQEKQRADEALRASASSTSNETKTETKTTTDTTTKTTTETAPKIAKADDAPKPLPTYHTPVVHAPPPVTTTTEKKAEKKTETAKTETKTAKTETKTESKPEGTGSIRTFSAAAGKTITVDGTIVGVAPAPVSVSCGTHQVALGSSPAKTVNVPCNSAITIGDPDGN